MPDAAGGRELVIESFLAGNGWALEDAAPLADDASFRRYLRLARDGRRAVLMDAPPPHEDAAAFARIARLLTGLGFSAPRVLAEDTAGGLLLLEDLGDATFSRRLAAGADERRLYDLAIATLVALHGLVAKAAIPLELPAYDDNCLLAEATLLTDWYLPAVRGAPTPQDERAAYVAVWREALAPVRAQPRTLTLRDFHVDNLMELPGRRGVARCGLLDFQDAVAGPAAYDVMSLLQDARRDPAPGLEAAMLERYCAAVPALAGSGLAREAFLIAYTVLAAQRHAKVIGIFTRLCIRDGKPAYLRHIPRVWRMLEAALDHAALAGVRDWFDRHVPAGDRRVPPCVIVKR